MFLVSKCRGELNLALCTPSVLGLTLPLCNGEFQRILRPITFLNRRSAPLGGILFVNTEIVRRPRFNSTLYFDIASEHIANSNGKIKC